MYRGMTAAVLEPIGNAKVVLQSVNVEAVMENLLCEVTVCQIYRNMEKINIEAVYTFPLPLNAVLLDMTIKTKTKVLKGVVIEKSEAVDKYEEAITDGDTAIMLEQLEPGLYTMNVGNLQPEDEIKISFTYAELYKWRDNSLRFFLPTTIAPRYGDPEQIGIQPHQTPEHDLMTDNPFRISLTVFGEMASAFFQSPSHRLQITSHLDKTVITLKEGEALMDRDFVLNILLESEEKSFGLFDRDFKGYVSLASFRPNFPEARENTPRCVTIIVDCSGSMGGDSITQARKALYEILELLRPQDTFNVIRFGSTYKMLFNAPVKAAGENLKKAKNLLETLDADMGGTEIGQAVTAALKSPTPEGISKEVLLITDGEVWEWEKVSSQASKSGFRFFTVGIGSSVSEAFVQTLAEVTGGACELVSPREDMAEKIVRHFKRIYFPRAENVSISWPCEPAKVLSGQLTTLYDGDTLNAFARFQKKPEGTVTLTASLENGETFTQSIDTRETAFAKTETDLPDTLARLAAACEIQSLIELKDTAALAVKYQLMSPQTNYLAIEVMAEDGKAVNLPALRKTTQMLAAGWGGTGSVQYEISMDYECQHFVDSKRESVDDRPASPKSRVVQLDLSDIDAILNENHKQDVINFIDALNRMHTGSYSHTLAVVSIQDLKASGVPDDIFDELVELHKSGVAENIIVVVFLYLLSHHENSKNTTSRQLKRVIAKAYKQLHDVDEEIAGKIEKIVCDNV